MSNAYIQTKAYIHTNPNSNRKKAKLTLIPRLTVTSGGKKKTILGEIGWNRQSLDIDEKGLLDLTENNYNRFVSSLTGKYPRAFIGPVGYPVDTRYLRDYLEYSLPPLSGPVPSWCSDPVRMFEIATRLDSENGTRIENNVGYIGMSDHIATGIFGKSPIASHWRHFFDPEIELGKADVVKCVNEVAAAPSRGGGGTVNSLSFASKFCHYIRAYYVLKDRKKCEIPIYDSVVCEALPYYEKYHLPMPRPKGVSVTRLRSKRHYSEYYDLLNDLRVATGLTFDQLDLILWWGYRDAKDVKTKVANKSILTKVMRKI